MSRRANAEVPRRAIEAFEVGDVGVFPELFTDDVIGWSPIQLTDGLDALVAEFTDFETALTDVTVQIDAVDGLGGNKALAEYRVTGQFTAPFVMDDAVLEPNGRTVVVGAAMVAEFEDGRIKAYRNYFDDMTLLEQLLMA